MTTNTIIGTTVLVIFMILYEWPKLHDGMRKEKAAFIVLTSLGWLLITLIVLFPELPGTVQLAELLFGPLNKMLVK